MSKLPQPTETDEMKVSYGEELWTTEFDGKITDINVNGNRIMEIHDMAKKLHTLVVAFTCMCVVALCMFGAMLYIVATTHPSIGQIERVIDSSEKIFINTKAIMHKQKHHINGTEAPTKRRQPSEAQQ